VPGDTADISQPVAAAPERPGPTFVKAVAGPASDDAGNGGWSNTPLALGRPTSPTPPVAPQRRRRLGFFALAIIAALAVAAGAFFFGRSFGGSETVTTPISADPTVEAPTTVPTLPPATVAPATPVPAPVESSANDVQSPLQLPADAAEEPVAAVAQAVAPAVVLIQHELGQGSGIIYEQEGFILTNAHVVGQFSEVLVTLASGVRVPGQVLGADELTDVAVVKIDTDAAYGVAVLAPDDSVQVGQLAVAIGSPFGLEQTVTSGIVSAKGRVLLNPTEDGGESIVAMIQTDAPINPGNSGGALADRQGRVIGMNTSIRTDGSGGNIGVGFAIPSDTARLIADRIIAGEPLEQGFLGINGGTPFVGEPGVVITVVTPGSGAAIAGLAPDDRITGFNGIEIKSMSDLAAAVRLQSPEATITVEFVREGEALTVDVTLGTFS